MRKFLAILVCKLSRFAGKLLGKGSSMPGKLALKVCPNILGKISLPKYIIAVTGSNGKTSTVEMIAHVMEDAGLNIAYNKEGSNQIEGVATFILNNCTMGGKFKKDYILIESDERYAKYTFKHFSPTHYVIVNLYRDQLTRNGHPLWVYDAIKESIPESTKLILNADDPLISTFGEGRKNVVWYGMDNLSTDTNESTGVYDDGKYCPVCGGKLSYDYRHFNHIGSFSCEKCGFKKHHTDYTVTGADLEKGVVEIDGSTEIDLAFTGIYNVYNILAAYAACSTVGINKNKISASLNNFVLKNGRIVRFKLGDRTGVLLASKHENSISYEQSLTYAATRKVPGDVVVIVDRISRKYYTGDTSWLWDINFDILNSDSVNKIYLMGLYCSDLELRFSYTNIPKDKIKVFSDIHTGIEELRNGGKEEIYVVTCFSDKEKFLSETTMLQ